MACQITEGLALQCKTSGGIQTAYFFNKGDISVTYDGVQTDLISDLGTASCYKYDIRSASNLVNTQTATDNGVGVDQVITLIIVAENVDTAHQLKLMGKGLTHVVIHYKNGDARVVGVNFGTLLTTAVSDSGTVVQDGTFYTLTLTAQEMCAANYLDGSTIEDAFVGLTSQPTIVA